MSEAFRGAEPQRLDAREILRLRCFGEAVRAIEHEAGLIWTERLETVVSQEIEAAFSVMEATRQAIGPPDFAVFFLGQLAEALPRREDRDRARIGMMRYLVLHRAELGQDLATLADEAEVALAPPKDPAIAEMVGRYVSDGKSVSEAFLTAYSSLRPVFVRSPQE